VVLALPQDHRRRGTLDSTVMPRLSALVKFELLMSARSLPSPFQTHRFCQLQSDADADSLHDGSESLHVDSETEDGDDDDDDDFFEHAAKYCCQHACCIEPSRMYPKFFAKPVVELQREIVSVCGR